nr:DUF982 domain-containing protein [Rhizobium sp. T1473]
MSAPGWIAVIVERNQAFHMIGSAEDALDLLFTNWPVFSGTAFVLAMETCAGTATGAVTQGETLSAFLAAAHDAKVVCWIA